MGASRRFLARFLAPGAIACAALLLAGCTSNLPATTTEPFGDHAQRIYDLLVPIFWMALAVFVVVEALLIYAVIRFKQGKDGSIPAQIHGNTRVEILWTIAPALIVLVIAVMTFRTQAANSTMPQNAVEVTAVGHQWWFEFRYPKMGANGADLVTATDMYIPVGQPVKVSLQSQDVIHNFWVPKLAGKTYMIPGQNKTNYLAFTASEPGVYYAVCSEFCGEQHALMRFRVIALPPDQYQSWLNQAKSVPAAPAAGTASGGDPARGQALFLDAKKQCIACHVVDGTNARGVTGPNLTYYGSRTTIAAGTLPNTPENLVRWLHDPNAIKPGNLMGKVIKPGSLSEQEIADLVAYLESMKHSVALPAAK